MNEIERLQLVCEEERALRKAAESDLQDMINARSDAKATERERCAKYCETMAAYWARCGNNTAEEAANTLAMGIRGEG